MPELPEVETVKRGLERLIVGKTIQSVEFDWPKSFPNSATDVSAFLVNAIVTDVGRRAKVLLVNLSSGYTLVIHLKMTGQLVFVACTTNETRNKKHENQNKFENRIVKQEQAFGSRTSDLDASKSDEIRFGAGHPNDSLTGKLPDKSTRVQFLFTDGSHLYFNDQRKFGWVMLVESQLVESLKFMMKLGPEPLESNFTVEVFKERIRKRLNTTIKAALLDQTVLAGIGNIYADESLWGASIHPSTRVKDLTDAQLKVLHGEIIFVLNLSIEKGGSTDKNYVNAEGKRGSYIDFARVFRREGLACPRCGTTVEKLRVAGRGTHVCPKCQVGN
jgi:formamidopyrimidine-DNA glycosylase